MLTDLGFRVVLSPRSDKELFEEGIETIPSDTVCYPAKMSHGHIMALIKQGVPTIFYPSVLFEQEEQKMLKIISTVQLSNLIQKFLKIILTKFVKDKSIIFIHLLIWQILTVWQSISISL